MAGPVVRTENLTKVYGAGETAVRAVDGISLELSEGQLVLIMGPSGSGKTTLLSMLGGLLRPTSGKAFINGTEISALRGGALADVRARQIGFVFQAFNLLSSLTAEENVLFPAGLVGGSRREARERAAHLLERLGLAHRRRHLPRDLSGGEKQRTAVARALINNPRVVMADEPTGNLDSKSGYEVMMLLHDIAREEGRTVLIVTHDPRLEDVADRLLWIEDGRLSDRKREAREWVVDPVCGMRLDKGSAVFTSQHHGQPVYFCSRRCQERFERAPATFASPKRDAPVA